MADPESRPLRLLPPAPHLCQACAVEHGPNDAHDRDSLYYQMKFNEAHGRTPTWADAIAHVEPEEVRAFWRKELKDLGVWDGGPERGVSM